MQHKLPGYLVHAFTALGAVLGLWALLATAQRHFQLALWLLFITVIIDSVDGTLARKARVHENIPGFDGALLDNIIDYLNWVIVPLFWAWQVFSIPGIIVIICGVASVWAFSRSDAKTPDHFFRGFPSYWSIVVLHMYALRIGPAGVGIILLICALLIFIPMLWIYPSRALYLRKTMVGLGILYGLQMIVMIILFPTIPLWLAWFSLLYPFIYFCGSVWLNFKRKALN